MEYSFEIFLDTYSYLVVRADILMLTIQTKFALNYCERSFARCGNIIFDVLQKILYTQYTITDVQWSLDNKQTSLLAMKIDGR